MLSVGQRPRIGRGRERHGRGGPAGHDARDGWQVAPAVHREGMRRPTGRAEAGRPAHGQRRGSRTGGDDDARVDAAGRHAVEHALDGEGVRHEFRDGEPDLAGLRPAAAPHGDLQALDRPAVHRKGARCRGALHGPAGAGGRALRGREVADPGARPHPADASAASGDARPPDPRLQAQRHHLALRRPRHRYRRGHWKMLSAPPVRRVQEVPRGHREGGAEGAGRPSGPRQLRHPQNRDDPQVASQAPTLPPAFHPDQRVMAQPDRTLVRRDHQQADPARELPEHPRTRAGHRGLPGRPQRGSQALRLDEVRGRHPGIPEELLRKDYRDTGH